MSTQPPTTAIRPAARTAPFTESVIREMSRIAAREGSVNLAQGFPDFAAPAAMKEAAKGAMKGVLAYEEDPIVSSDIIGHPASSIFDSLATMVIGDNQVKVVSWYDNEWGYSSRVVELMKKAHAMKAPAKKAKKTVRKKAAKKK